MWTLILLSFYNPMTSGGPGSAFASVPGFVSQAACDVARKRAEKTFRATDGLCVQLDSTEQSHSPNPRGL